MKRTKMNFSEFSNDCHDDDDDENHHVDDFDNKLVKMLKTFVF